MTNQFISFGDGGGRAKTVQWLAVFLTTLRRWFPGLRKGPRQVLHALWRWWSALCNYFNRLKARMKCEKPEKTGDTQVLVSTICTSRIPEHLNLREESPVTITVTEESDGEQMTLSTPPAHIVNPVSLPLPTPLHPRPSSITHSYQDDHQSRPRDQGNLLRSHSTPRLSLPSALRSSSLFSLSRSRLSNNSSRVSGRAISLQKQTSASSSSRLQYANNPYIMPYMIESGILSHSHSANERTAFTSFHADETNSDELRSMSIFPVNTIYIVWCRYNIRPQIKRQKSSLRIPTLTLDFSGTEDLLDWVPFVHPEGALYFYHNATSTYTSMNMYDSRIRNLVQDYLDKLEKYKLGYPDMPANIDCMIYLEQDEENSGHYSCYYYFADHDKRILFWLNEFLAEDMLQEVDSCTDFRHFKYELESHYWVHWELYPGNRIVSDALLFELTDILVYAGYDALSSTVSIQPFNNSDIQDQLVYVKHLRELGEYQRGGYAGCVVSRMMSTFMHEKFLNFAGQSCAKLNRDQAIYEGPSGRRSSLIMFISPLLFFAPDVYLSQLEKVWIDNMINQRPWNALINKLNEEWREIVLYSTVLLSANTALLAVPDVDSDFQKNRNPVQIISYISILSSVGSIVLGLLLVRQYRTKARNMAQDAAKYLDENKHPTRGLETMAIMNSLPYAGLMWGMVTFFGALSALFFIGTSYITRIVSGTVAIVVIVFIAWCIGHTWSEQND